MTYFKQLSHSMQRNCQIRTLTSGPTLRANCHYYFSLWFCSLSSRMQKLQEEKSKCSVVGFSDPHASLHRLPAASEPLRSAWLSFIYKGNFYL